MVAWRISSWTRKAWRTRRGVKSVCVVTTVKAQA